SWWWAASSPASTRSEHRPRAAPARLRPSGGARDATGSGEGMTLPDIRIETERLLLRLPQAEDFDRFAELVGDPVAARYIGGHLPRGAAWRKFLQQPGAWAIQGFGMFSFIDRDSGRWLGQGGPWRPGWLARQRDRLHAPPRCLGQGLRHRGAGGCDRLGARTPGLERVHPLHRAREHRL